MLLHLLPRKLVPQIAVQLTVSCPLGLTKTLYQIGILWSLDFFFLFRERESMSGEGQREERESQAGFTLSAEPDMGLHLMALRL